VLFRSLNCSMFTLLNRNVQYSIYVFPVNPSLGSISRSTIDICSWLDFDLVKKICLVCVTPTKSNIYFDNLVASKLFFLTSKGEKMGNFSEIVLHKLRTFLARQFKTVLVTSQQIFIVVTLVHWTFQFACQDNLNICILFPRPCLIEYLFLANFDNYPIKIL